MPGRGVSVRPSERILRRLPAPDDAGVHDLSRARDGVEEHLVAVDLGGEKLLIGIETFGGECRPRDG